MDRIGNTESDQQVIPTVAAWTKDKITFVGRGCCGQLGKDRVSILTRKP